jgi:hypothetical protein
VTKARYVTGLAVAAAAGGVAYLIARGPAQTDSGIAIAAAALTATTVVGLGLVLSAEPFEKARSDIGKGLR